jgi:hypothetical protein
MFAKVYGRARFMIVQLAMIRDRLAKVYDS